VSRASGVATPTSRVVKRIKVIEEAISTP